MNFENARETVIKSECRPEDLKVEIIALLKSHNLSLSNIRALFHGIVNELEDAPLI